MSRFKRRLAPELTPPWPELSKERNAHNTGERIIHGYDTTARRVLCGISQQASSTKHFHFVTCTACRERMHGSPAGTPDRPAGPRGG